MIFWTVRQASRHELAEDQPRRTARSLYTKSVIRTPGKAPPSLLPYQPKTASSNIGRCLFSSKELDGLPNFSASPCRIRGAARDGNLTICDTLKAEIPAQILAKRDFQGRKTARNLEQNCTNNRQIRGQNRPGNPPPSRPRTPPGSPPENSPDS